MPKKVESIEEFHGGMINTGSGRNLKPEHSQEIVNMNPNSEAGGIAMHGTGLDIFTLNNDKSEFSSDILAGFGDNFLPLSKVGAGLFKINSDYAGLLSGETTGHGTGQLSNATTGYWTGFYGGGENNGCWPGMEIITCPQYQYLVYGADGVIGGGDDIVHAVLNLSDSSSTWDPKESTSVIIDNSAEYFFLVTDLDAGPDQTFNNDDDETFTNSINGGMYVNVIRNMTDGSNFHNNLSPNLNGTQAINCKNAWLKSVNSKKSHPTFFYASGGVRLVDGNETEAYPSPYWYFRPVKTDFGLQRQKFLTNEEFTWSTGDTPYTSNWVVNNLKDRFYEDNPNGLPVGVTTAGLPQPKQSYSHARDVLYHQNPNSPAAAGSELYDTGQMEDGTCMFMICNTYDNFSDAIDNQADGLRVNSANQLRACTGKDIIKVQMLTSTTAGGTEEAGGGWDFDLNTDEFYMSYVYDNGMESALTRVIPWWAGLDTTDDNNSYGETGLDEGEAGASGFNYSINLGYDGITTLDNIRWYPEHYTVAEDDASTPNDDSIFGLNDEYIQSPSETPASEWNKLGGAFVNGKAKGLYVKFQCMIGNQTARDSSKASRNFSDQDFVPYSLDTETCWDGSWSSTGLESISLGMKGIRLYLKSVSSFVSDSIYMLCDIDLEKGMRTNGSTRYSPWDFRTYSCNYGYWDGWHSTPHSEHTENAMAVHPEATEQDGWGSWMFSQTDVMQIPIPVESYEILNTYSRNEMVMPSFKTATVLNNRTYIGNVQFSGEKYPDRMMKSLINKYDSFARVNFIDIETQDADEIIHLASFGDKLLQFKRNICHVVATQEDYEVLDSSYRYAGVSNSSQVTTTDFGIIWANINGLFFYNGSKLQNLLDFEGTELLDTATWKNIMSSKEDEQVIVGYNAPTKDIIIMVQKRADQTDIINSRGFVYNLYKKNIVKLERKFGTVWRSNFVNTTDGSLVYFSNENTNQFNTNQEYGGKSGWLYKWDSTPSTENLYSGVLLKTRDITFTNPSTRKTITSLYITYKSKLDTFVNIEANIKKIGGNEEVVKNLGGTLDYTLPDTEDKWTTVRIRNYYDEDTLSQKSIRTKFKNLTSLSLIFKRKFGVVPSTFTIDDISVTFRAKAIR